MKPDEFWNSTYRDLKVFVEFQNKLEREKTKEQILIAEALGNKLIFAFTKKPKRFSLIRDAFPDLFEEELKPKQQTIEEQVRNLRSRE